MMMLFFFFFSSRRRHTRLVSDWSSDVCSSDLEQNIPGMAVPGDSRVADRPEEDRVYVVAQVAERRLRERLARREVVIGAVGKALEVESEAVLRGGLLDRPERRRDDLGADAVSRDHGDAMVVFHSKPVARPQLTQ